jgi:dTDP-4-dehydrorhamnose reductase
MVAQTTTMQLVQDQVSNPTWCRMLAEITSQLLAMAGEYGSPWLAERSGIYHLAGWGYASRFEWTQAILANDPKRGEQVIQELQPALTSEFPTPAQRPLFSALKCDHFADTFGLSYPPGRMPSTWQWKASWIIFEQKLRSLRDGSFSQNSQEYPHFLSDEQF